MTDIESPYVFDLVGVGFGPANLAVAALQSSPGVTSRGVESVQFYEQRPAFAWHTDMLLPGATMQVAFCKDLVTPKDPTSPFSFLNYLVTHGRLEQFLNLGTLYPSREEFSDYLTWVARQQDAVVRYGTRVDSIEPVFGADEIVALRIVTVDSETGERDEVHARHLSIGTGGQPYIARGVDPATLAAGSVFHSSSFLTGIRRYEEAARLGRPLSFLVVGAGQSAAEITRYLHDAFPTAELALAHKGFALQPANDSPLANAIFDPASVDLFYDANETLRSRMMEELRTTNYAGVDEPDIDALAHILYRQQINGGSRLDVLRFTTLMACEVYGDRARATLHDQHTGQTTAVTYDAVVLATGYDFGVPQGLLEAVEPYLSRDDMGDFRLDRDYHLKSVPEFRPRIYVHGAAEPSHGLTSTLLSIVARRAGLVLESIESHTRELTTTERIEVI
ncbi:lysine N(6)-hydroxylase/L-ornithine N(5)-oxygenase family protein [Pseudarthrobacter oxydans]|uniref:lysine N(6)-hydroxylase/L-ornithine N(5)-oxygenase family protein n=1 Tax=Pseudarthrobacter oxydans TaxID=1671 RepID=UPI00342CC234